MKKLLLGILICSLFSSISVLAVNTELRDSVKVYEKSLVEAVSGMTDFADVLSWSQEELKTDEYKTGESDNNISYFHCADGSVIQFYDGGEWFGYIQWDSSESAICFGGF